MSQVVNRYWITRDEKANRAHLTTRSSSAWRSEYPIERNKNMAAILHLFDLACQRTEDSGNDEVYINYNGGRIYGGDDGESIAQGQTRTVEGWHFLSGEGTLSLHDEDWPDSDDWLGSWRVTEGEVGQGIRVATFDMDDAHYTLRYEVLRLG